jgi:hypothetical protein
MMNKEDYSPTEATLRATAVLRLAEQVGEHFALITIVKPSLEHLPDALFSKAYLEKFAK